MLTARQEQELARMQLDSVMRDFQFIRNQLAQTRKELATTQAAAMHALAAAIGARIPGQALRQKRIATIAVTIARHNGYPAALCREIGLVAPLYNLGLLTMSDASLAAANQGEPNASLLHEQIERGLTLVGCDTALQRIACDVIRHHREHWDGSGTPDGMYGEHIPYAARVVAVAESFDRMLHGTHEIARQQARNGFAQLSGRQLDPQLVSAALANEARTTAVSDYISQHGKHNSDQPEIALMSVLL